MTSTGQSVPCSPAKAPQPLRRESPIKFQSQLFLSGKNISRIRCTLSPPKSLSRSPTPPPKSSVSRSSTPTRTEGLEFGFFKSQIPYKLDLRKQLGYACDSVLPVISRFCRPSKGSKRMLFNHTNYLPCLGVHKAIGLGVDEEHKEDDVVLYKRPEKCFPDFLLFLELPPVHEDDIFGRVTSYIPEEFRHFGKGIIDCVAALHIAGYSFDTESLSVSRNLAFDNGNAVLYDFDIREMDSDSKKADYVLTASLIEQIFGKGEDVPFAMKALIRKMRHYRDGDEALFSRHISLLPYKETVCFIKSCAEKNAFFKAKGLLDDYNIALRNMNRAHGWIDRVVKESYDPIKKFYRANRLRDDPTEYIDSVDRDGNTAEDKDINSSLFWFNRNLCTHVGQSRSEAKVAITERQMDLMLMNKFGEFYVSFQEELFYQYLLGEM